MFHEGFGLPWLCQTTVYPLLRFSTLWSLNKVHIHTNLVILTSLLSHLMATNSLTVLSAVKKPYRQANPLQADLSCVVLSAMLYLLEVYFLIDVTCGPQHLVFH
jgi:hypothetical protein